jgi:transmembrane sensor
MKLQNQIDQLLAARASEWHEILHAADESQRAEFVAWLKASPLHVKEYLEIAYTDRALDHIDAQRLHDVDAMLAQLGGTLPLKSEEAESVGHARRRFTLWALGLAASVALGVFTILALYQKFHSQTFVTRIGEQRTLQLADTSMVTLNTDSDIKVRLDDQTRNIELRRGEAWFKVAHDAHRPFLVKTQSATIQAVGTQFNVYEQPDGTQVTVLEGRVKVSSASDTQSLGAGEEAQVSSDGKIQRNAKADVLKTMAWRERRLVFSETPLEEIVREFNRYNPTQHLSLRDISPGSHHFNGIFDATDPESLAALLSKEPDLIVERRDSEIIIRHRD